MKKMFAVSAMAASVFLAGCEMKKEEPSPAQLDPGIEDAIAVVNATEGNSAHGIVRFHQIPGAVEISADITGLPPDSDHGFHIHEFGDASAAKGTSAGGHFNPEGATHGGPTSPHHHAGDLGNLHADASGRAVTHLTMQGITIGGPNDAILGRSVVVHKSADDLMTQPTGNSGDRIGVGVIGIAQKPVAAPK